MAEFEKTFVAIKPDAVKRGYIGEIIGRFERKGYKIVGLKMLNVSQEQAASHYAEHVGKPFYEGLVKFITSGPIVAIAVSGLDAVNGCRQIIGATDPLKGDVGTIRADLGCVMNMNIVHGSDSVESGAREIGIYFNENELCENYKNMFEIVREELG